MVRLIAMSASRFDRLNSRAVATSCRSRSGVPLGEFYQPRGQEVAAEPVGGADPHRAGEPGARAADRLLAGDDGGFHRLGAVGDALAGLGQQVAGLAAIEQFGRQMPLQTVDPPDHRGMIDPELLGGGRHRSAADDRQHEAEVIPVDGAKTLIQHFRTSMVQFIGLVSQEMQVKKGSNTFHSVFERSGHRFA
jgi:hypothetical protein